MIGLERREIASLIELAEAFLACSPDQARRLMERAGHSYSKACVSTTRLNVRSAREKLRAAEIRALCQYCGHRADEHPVYWKPDHSCQHFRLAPSDAH